MNTSITEHYAGHAEDGRDGDRFLGDRARQREDPPVLPSLPTDCWPEPGARPDVTPEAPLETPRSLPPASSGPPRTEAAAPREIVKAPRRQQETFEDLLRSLVGRQVTVVDSESYEEVPVGYRIGAAFYGAQMVGMGDDYIVLAGEFVHRSAGTLKSRTTEPIRQYIPIARIKRISTLGSKRLIHF